MFFSGAVTSSPIKARPPLDDESCQSLGRSLLCPDSSYVCYSSPSADGAPCCCRRSPRLLTNGYYVMTEDSFSWDDHGNVSLTPSKTNVSYKENVVRIFRRRRRRRRSLASLLSGVTDSCQSWLDEKVFRGVFSAPAADPSWPEISSTELDSSCSFTYDHTEVPPPPDKVAPPSQTLIQEEICSEIYQSQERFTQSLGGLSEVPPPSAFYANSCCPPTSPEHTGLTTTKALLLFIFTIFIFTSMYSRCLLWGCSAAATTLIIITTFMFATRSGPMGEWRKAKTEDITSRNE